MKESVPDRLNRLSPDNVVFDRVINTDGYAANYGSNIITVSGREIRIQNTDENLKNLISTKVENVER